VINFYIWFASCFAVVFVIAALLIVFLGAVVEYMNTLVFGTLKWQIAMRQLSTSPLRLCAHIFYTLLSLNGDINVHETR